MTKWITVTDLGTFYKISARRAEWREALRHGGLPQARNYLAISSADQSSGPDESETAVISYCCLGVAAKLFHEDAGMDFDLQEEESEIAPGSDSRTNIFVLRDRHSGVMNTQNLTERMTTYLGLSVNSQTLLTYLNDRVKATFEQIADCLEYLPVERPEDES
jgi:hypothetical protein